MDFDQRQEMSPDRLIEAIVIHRRHFRIWTQSCPASGRNPGSHG
jgi:hypothetical protein